MSNDQFVNDGVVQIELNSESGYYMESVDDTLNSFIVFGNIRDNEYNSETEKFDSEAGAESDKENLNPSRFLSTREQLEKLDSSLMEGK